MLGRRVAALRGWTGAVLLVLACASANATTWYVRTDGGDAQQCSGRVDRALDASGACAWSHPFVALPPGGAPRIAGGDTLHIGPGQYRMGIGAPDSDRCATQWSWDCHMPPVPSGPTAQEPTRILGSDRDGQCQARPQLWGTERAARVLDLQGSRNVEIACLELTDHSSCVEHHCHGGGCKGEVLACDREDAPFGDWAGTGIHARDASTIVLRDVDVVGFALRGMQVGRVHDITLQRVRILGNGWSGWDGDLGGGEDSSNSGTLRFVDVEIAFNGCAWRWPDGGAFGCWAQQAGGYGDGLGTAATGGHWIFEGGSIHHNTSDGLDLLYLRADARLEVERTSFHANAGNQLKFAGNGRVEDAVIDGDCGAFSHGPHASANMLPGDHCRALGNAVVAVAHADASIVLGNNRIRGRGDCLVVVEKGDASASVLLRDNVLEGAGRFADPGQRSCGFYAHESKARVRLEGNRSSGVRR